MNDNTVSDAHRYFTFLLGDAMYAVDIQSVKEVLTAEPVTKVPRSAEYLQGVINIRGAVISVLDFRPLFGIPHGDAEKSTSLIVLEVQAETEPPLLFGFIADAVEGVGELDAVVGKDTIQTGTSENKSRFVKKIARLGERLVLILDIPAIVAYIETDLEKRSKTT